MTFHFDNIARKLLSLEHRTIAKRLGFSEIKPGQLSYDDVCDAVKSLNLLSLEKNESDRNTFVTIAALLWEYAGADYPNLRDVLIHLLSRIGYAPSSIILDKEFRNSGKYAPLSSIFAQMATGINQQKYEVVIGNQKETLTAYQHSVSNSIRNNKITGVSAPTSAGKSYVLLIEATHALTVNKWDVVYIVPTISLINQVTRDFANYFQRLGVYDVEIFNSYNPDLVKTETPHVFILTQERAASAFTMSEKPFNKKTFLIIDEIQNIERISSGDSEMRSKILLDTIYDFRFLDNIEKIVVSGARIHQIDTLCKELLGDDCVDNTTDISPVLNLTYSIKKDKEHYYFKQYCSIIDAPNSVRISNPALIEGHGKKLYNDLYLQYLSNFISNLGDSVQNIIFTPNPATARRTALALTTNDKPMLNELQSLAEYLRDSVRSNYALAETISKGIAYHHGKLPQHVRKVVEYAISEKYISNVVCTTTLMQGVNMPAQNVIVRNPHLYIKSGVDVAELSSYEMANLRGRAGRLLKDFIGRSFVLDENEFLKSSDEYTQETLFEDSYKELSSSYSSIYNQHSEEIKNAISNKTPASQLPKSYAFIVTHIRQTILRHGKDARNRLDKIGIIVTDNEFASYENSLLGLQVPRAVCLKNRYADPVILNLLYLDKSLPVLPTDIKRGAEAKLSNVLKYLRDTDTFATLYNERIPDRYRKGKNRGVLCGTAIKWAKQTALSEILKAPYYNEPDKVDEAITLLQNTISYDLPMLLKPIYDAKDIEPTFITFLEAGANMPITRKLIEIGIPRETAIYLYDNIFGTLQMTSDDIYSSIITTITNNRDKIPFWVRVQLPMPLAQL